MSFIKGMARDLARKLGRHASLQTTAIVFISFVCVIVAGIQAIHTLSTRSLAIANGSRDTANLAQSAAQHAEDAIRTADAVLIGLVERLEHDGRAPQQLERLRQLFAEQVATLPQLKGLSFIDESGISIINSLPVTQRISFADREYFQFHRTHSDRGPHVSKPVVSKPMGVWIIPVSRRVNHADGSFAGIMLATLDMAYFQKFYDKFNLGENGTIFLATADGIILARRPFDEANIGRSIQDGAIFHTYLPNAPFGTHESRSMLDGVDRLFSYRQTEAYQLVAGVSRDKNEVLAEWRKDAWHDLLSVALLVVSIATFGMLFTGQIARRAKAEQASKEGERRYRLLADYSSDMIVLSSMEDNKRLYVSPASRRLYGYEPEELMGQSVETITHPDDIDTVKKATQALENSDHALATYRARRKDGRYIWVEARWRRIVNAETGAFQRIGNARDVTERVNAEEALQIAKEQADAARKEAEAANQAKSEFLANMSHEIRTPMNGIIGMIHILLGTALTDEQLDYAKSISACGETLLVLINDILDIAKLEARAMVLEKMPFDLAALVETAISVLTPRAREKGVAVSAAVPSELQGVFVGDPTRIRQVLLNLAGNAVKFTEAGSVSIEVSVSEEAAGLPKLRFEVIDTGIGIPANALPKLFQKFTQADGSIARKFGGTGLGLAISKQLVEAMGGTIGVESKERDGSRFWFELPLVPATSTEVPKTRALSTSLVAPRNLRVLLVEDNAVNQQVARLILTKAGHTVEIAESGRKAIDAVQSGSFDVVLMDIQMSDVDGIHATARIRALAPPACDVPIIAMTANALEGAREEYLAAGMNDYVSKPFNPPDLIAKLDRVAINAAEPISITGHATSAASLTAPAFDPAKLDELKQLVDEDKFNFFVGQFTEGLEARIGRFAIALQLSSWAEAAREAHDVVSVAGQVGAERLSALARDLEHACKADDEATCRTISAVFMEVAVNALRALKMYQTAA